MGEAETKLLALALFELRVQLGGVGKDAPHEIQFAWWLAYALHNDAWAVIENKSFDHEATLARIADIDRRIGGDYGKQLAEQFRQAIADNPI